MRDRGAFVRYVPAYLLLIYFLTVIVTTVSAQTQTEPTSGGGDMGVFLLCMILQLLIPLAILGVLIYLAVWSYKDAKSRNWENPALAPILILLGSWIGLIVYMLLRPKGDLVPCRSCTEKKLSTLPVCPHCGGGAGGGSSYSGDGIRTAGNQKLCSACYQYVPADASTCPHCGAVL
ncbi:MAG: hypothetical protein KAH57_07770 [Thermoplasmata archaeon]|nr:hypothetical protein [Thermoplasmata archaeon]